MHNKRFAVLLLFVLALITSGCAGSSAPQQDSGTSQPGFPVRIEHKYGTTELKAPPKRVVTLGYTDHETVLAFGIKPVGVVDWFQERPFGNWPWTKKLWGKDLPEIVGARDEYNMEKIAALKPDLIIAQYSAMRREQYETLSKIAPTVAQSPKHDDFRTPWQETTRIVGRALGKSAKAEGLIRDVENKFASVRKQHPEFAQQELALVDSYKPGTFGSFSPEDAKPKFMTQLGFRPPEELNRVVGDRDVAELGFEQLHLLDVDRLVWMTSTQASAEAVRSHPLYQRLRVARENRDVFLSYMDPPVGAALSFNSVLSLPYAIDQVVPQLAGTGN